MSSNEIDVKKSYEQIQTRQGSQFSIKMANASAGLEQYETTIDNSPFSGTVRKFLLATLQRRLNAHLPQQLTSSPSSKPISAEELNQRVTPRTPAFVEHALAKIFHDSFFQRELAVAIATAIRDFPVLKQYTANELKSLAEPLGKKLGFAAYTVIPSLAPNEKRSFKKLVFDKMQMENVVKSFFEESNKHNSLANPHPSPAPKIVSPREKQTQIMLISLATANLGGKAICHSVPTPTHGTREENSMEHYTVTKSIENSVSRVNNPPKSCAAAHQSTQRLDASPKLKFCCG